MKNPPYAAFLLVLTFLALAFAGGAQAQVTLGKPQLQNVPPLALPNDSAQVLFAIADPSTATKRQVLSANKADFTTWLNFQQSALTLTKATRSANAALDSNVSPQPDAVLLLPIASSGSYRVTTDLITNSNIRVQWTFPVQEHPSGVTIGTCTIGGTSVPIVLSSATSTTSISSASSGMSARFILHNVTTGNVQVRWAQNTSSATATTIYSGSSLILEKL